MGEDGPPKCQSYENEYEHLGQLCEKLGLDCSNCYDREDLERLIVGGFERLQREIEKRDRVIKAAFRKIEEDIKNHWDAESWELYNEIAVDYELREAEKELLE